MRVEDGSFLCIHCLYLRRGQEIRLQNIIFLVFSLFLQYQLKSNLSQMTTKAFYLKIVLPNYVYFLFHFSVSNFAAKPKQKAA